MIDAIARTNGLSIWKLNDGRWQISTKNDDGSFRVHIGELGPTMEKALREAGAAVVPPDDDDEWRNLI